MLDLHQKHERTHFSSFHHSPYQSKTKTEFNFWDEQRTNHCDVYGNQIQFQAQTQAQDDDCLSYSPPFWSKNASNIEHENSTLLPKNRHNVCPSPTSRVQVILNAQRELMKMIENMPESSYELSLKDIVDEQQTLQDVQELDNTSQNFGTNAVKMKQKKKKEIHSKRRGQISRSESMDSGVFLLKMFIPSFLGSKKKSRIRIDSRVCRAQSFDGPEKPIGGKEWWKIWSPVTISSKSSSSSSSNESTSSRHCDSNFRTDGWVSHNNKCISTRRRQRGCLF